MAADTKLDMLARTAGDDAFDCPMPPEGTLRQPSTVAAFARIVRYRVDLVGRARQDGRPVTGAHLVLLFSAQDLPNQVVVAMLGRKL